MKMLMRANAWREGQRYRITANSYYLTLPASVHFELKRARVTSPLQLWEEYAVTVVGLLEYFEASFGSGTCVLLPSRLSDVLFDLMLEGLYFAYWTGDVEAEFLRNWPLVHPGAPKSGAMAQGISTCHQQWAFDYRA